MEGIESCESRRNWSQRTPFARERRTFSCAVTLRLRHTNTWTCSTRDSAKTKAQFLASCQAKAVSQDGIVFDATFLAGELEATVDVMIRRQSLTPKPWQYYEPHLFVGNNVATNEHKIAVAFLCKTIEEASGSRPPTRSLRHQSASEVFVCR